MVGRRTSSVWIRLPARFAATSREFLESPLGADDEGPHPAAQQDAGRSPVAAGSDVRGIGSAGLHRHHRSGPGSGAEEETGDYRDPGGSVPAPESHPDICPQLSRETSSRNPLGGSRQGQTEGAFGHVPSSGRRRDQALVGEPEGGLPVRDEGVAVGALQEPVGEDPGGDVDAAPLPTVRGCSAHLRAGYPASSGRSVETALAEPSSGGGESTSTS